MSKALLYSLATAVDIVLAILAWRTGRVVIPVILLFAAVCFAIAAIGAARGRGGPQPPEIK